MKRVIAIWWICFCTVCIFSQKNESIPGKDVIIGRNFTTNADIKAKEFIFLDMIYQWNNNDSTKMLTLQLRGVKEDGKEQSDTGKIVLFDLAGEQILWEQKINYQQSSVVQYDNFLIKTDDDQSSCLDNVTGENLWSAKNSIIYVDSKQKVGVGYKINSSGELTNILEGIDLKTGNSLWKRKINREYSLNDISPLNDSVLLVTAGGLHTIHLKKGRGWDYDALTGKKDNRGVVAANILGATFSALLNTDYEFISGHDIITDVVSNTLMDSTDIYLADKESVARMDTDGYVLWKSDLPKKLVSKSSLFLKDSLLCMVNNGFATENSGSINYGKAFIAVFNKNTGKKIFLQTIGYKNQQILSYEIEKDTLTLLSKNRIFKHSLKDGRELNERYYKTDSLGEFTKFAEPGMYVLSDSVTIKPLLSDSTNLYVVSSKNQILVLNNQLDITNIIPNEKICFCYLETKGYKLIDAGESTFVIDKNNKLVAELDISGNATLIGTKLYEVQGKSLIEIDLDKLPMN